MRLIVGLGNPGPKYMKTRHNVGFMALDRLAELLGVSFKREKYKGHFAEARVGDARIVLLKPLTFMNLSGQSVALAARNVNEPDEVLIMYDEAELPLGRLRIRKSGSPGTHNGMRSVLERLGTREVPRFRLGVGAKSPGSDLTDHVLGSFRPDEWDEVEDMIDRAAHAAVLCIEDGIDQAMNKFNSRG